MHRMEDTPCGDSFSLTGDGTIDQRYSFVRIKKFKVVSEISACAGSRPPLVVQHAVSEQSVREARAGEYPTGREGRRAGGSANPRRRMLHAGSTCSAAPEPPPLTRDYNNNPPKLSRLLFILGEFQQ